MLQERDREPATAAIAQALAAVDAAGWTRLREMTEAYADTEVARIKAAESILKDYFEHAFADRRATFDGLFTRLDQALEKENADAINAVLRGIVDVARTSPLADLGDLSQIRAALDDPDQVWEL
ncbi:hypothetical protein Z051_02885 [Rhodococcus rhodochrous KG-21]|uniref:Uncharacterized protein n=1 Tax=Rhodococcus rhodochrous KG-21 TaxID=1441923 RepID=A0A0M8PJG1_RHORH|nr:hypothetical protein Z051_02885 [Rhodococcus rhodochrous KG-21]